MVICCLRATFEILKILLYLDIPSPGKRNGDGGDVCGSRGCLVVVMVVMLA